ncbi:hypothetical protein [Pyrobaculum neutrophilum]|uniref:Uncharacterized protein n=1 Tax=Pyrobaculum neutrophilum (strain DSM 2338 / JCM 9278 / NBRC 100436 / V24Sta) TaxID=444157 RepID=B1YDW7_PYRNV|nr:hypothetical protein [Pyrobaculum neutrophilum]ACB39980.1 conserved hypothetical protein [Pyrobaculum neutrophilum V24Sta]
MILLIVKTDSGEVAKRLARAVEGLELAPGLYLTWAPREKVARAVNAAKREAVRRWEEEGSGPQLEVAALELTEEQYRELRPLARGVIERAAEALLEEMERLLERLRSPGGRDLSGWYRDLARRYERLVNASIALDIEPTALGRLRDRWKEVALEAGRRLRRP